MKQSDLFIIILLQLHDDIGQILMGYMGKYVKFGSGVNFFLMNTVFMVVPL